MLPKHSMLPVGNRATFAASLAAGFNLLLNNCLRVADRATVAPSQTCHAPERSTPSEDANHVCPTCTKPRRLAALSPTMGHSGRRLRVSQLDLANNLVAALWPRWPNSKCSWIDARRATAARAVGIRRRFVGAMLRKEQGLLLHGR